MDQFFDLDNAEFCEAYVEEAFIADVQYEISRKMKSSGVSRAELARRLGVSAPCVTQYLGEGDGNLTLRTVARIFQALGERPIITHHPVRDLATACAESTGRAESDLTEAAIGLQWHEVQPVREIEWTNIDPSAREASRVSDAESNIVWFEQYHRARAA
jgi:predicted transcriptional regulator